MTKEMKDRIFYEFVAAIMTLMASVNSFRLYLAVFKDQFDGFTTARMYIGCIGFVLLDVYMFYDSIKTYRTNK